MRYYSPLRYPGGKGKIADFIKVIFKKNLLYDGCYVEPFAGGASVAIELLVQEYATEIFINDIDYSIYCFWYSVLNYTEELCQLIANTRVNVNEWHKQKYIQTNQAEFNVLDIGFSTFFLNRTNRSGILKGGIIGGKNQSGKWKIDARFNKNDLIHRIKKIALYKNRIHLYNDDALVFLDKTLSFFPENTLIYFDPPYYKNGKNLYTNFYTHDDHVAISEYLKSLYNYYWILTYDNTPEILNLYHEFNYKIFQISYTAGRANFGKEIMVFSKKLKVPVDINPTERKIIKRQLNSII